MAPSKLTGRELLEQLGAAGAEILAGLPSIDSATPLTTLSSRRSARACFRLELTNGERFKLRRHEHESRVEDLTWLRRHLNDGAFTSILAHRGDLTLESWIDGRPLAELTLADDQLVQAARILGDLHATKRLGEEAFPIERATAFYMQNVVSGLNALADAAALRPTEAEHLTARARRADPGRSSFGLLHNDFAADNLVVDDAGKVWCIDYESLDVGAFGYDIGRTLYRWPMSPPQWRTFLSSYAAHGGSRIDDEPLVFWRIAGMVASARYRLTYETADLSTAIDALRRLLDDTEG